MFEPFPLQLTAFEQLMLYQDQAFHPMVFELCCQVMGRIQPQVARLALEAASVRHPMLLARIQNQAWVLEPSFRVPLIWDSDPGEPLHPIRNGGARLVASQDSLRFEFHHASCDGEGASLFLRDFFQAYQAISEGSSPTWRAVDLRPLVRRDHLPWPQATVSQGANLPLSQHLRQVLEFLAYRPVQARTDSFGERVTLRGTTAYTFSREQTRTIVEKAKAAGMNLNTVALGLLFQTLARQPRRPCFPPFAERLRILMPVSNRSFSDFRMGATNRISYAYLTRRLQDALGEPKALFSGLQEEVKYVRQHRPDLVLLAGIDVAWRLGLLGLLYRWSRLQATAILSYMGDLSPRRGYRIEDGYYRVNDFALHSVHGSPPVTPGTPIAVGIGRVGDHLSIGWRSSPARFSRQTELSMLGDYLQGWRRWAGLKHDDVATQPGAGR